MPIDFPNNPTTGLTYSYGGQLWEYNGVGWDKVVIADLALDSEALYGISGYIYASSLATGLLYGGILSINSGNSAAFDITAGKGQIHASGSTYTAEPAPTLQFVTWPAQTGITLQYLATSDTTWIYVDGTGTVQQRTEYYTDTQLEENIIIGQLIHPSRTFINLARTNPNVAYATDKQYEQFIRSFGPIKVSGHTIQPNGANLKLNRTSGTAFSLGRNWINDTDNPSVVSDGAYTDCIFYRYYRGATAGTFITVPNQTAIDPTKYDDGTGTLATVPGGKYTIQRLFYYPNTPSLLGVYYGRAEYTSLADAAANINFENFTEIENTRTNAIFAGYLLVKSGATDLTNTSDALILQAGNFRSTTSGGGSVSLTLDDLTDVIITSPQNNQVLTYVDGVTGWENRSVSTLPLVSSIRGLTGAVGITDGSGIGLSVSGQTMTFSNTGVLSIDGGTGAITNVARTNVDNNFSASQTISLINPFLNLEDTNTSNMITFDVSSKSITFIDNTVDDGVETTLYFNPVGAIGFVNTGITFPSYSTVLAGLAGTQTFTGINTFTSRTNFNSGISASGGITFANDIRVNSLTVGRGAGNVDSNVAIGFNSFDANVSGSNNIAIGYDALGSNTIGNNNAAIGRSALGANTTGTDNVAIGNSSLQNITTNSKNIAIGSDAGRLRANGNVLTSATGGIYIGYNSRGFTLAQTNEIVIGTDALGLGSNTAVIGATSQTAATIYGLLNTPGGISAAGGTFSGTQTFVNGAIFQGNINAPNIVTSFNGSTGAIVGVNSVRGLTGAVGITNGSGIGLSVSGQTMTFSNTGVLSIDGGTGAITNVARTNIDNNFSASQTINLPAATLTVTDVSLPSRFVLDPSTRQIHYYNDDVLTQASLRFTNTNATVTLPNFTTTLAGLSGAQTFTGTKTFNALTDFPGGISASGATFSSLARFNAGISAAGGITFNSDVTVNSSNILNVGSIQSNKAVLEIDTSRAASRVAMGDYTALGNATFIYLRNATRELQLSNPFGAITIGDSDGYNTGYFINYDATSGNLYGNTSVISDFTTISCYNGFYETANSIRVTNNARSWFL